MKISTVENQTTLAASVGMDRTLRPEDAARGSSPPVVVRGGRTDDYRELTTIDAKHYVVGNEIARGGMGRILEARDRRLGRPVAIKELLVQSVDLRVRFEREARITAKLQHPAIINVLEAGAWPNGEPFYVMKLVSGESFDKVIAKATTLGSRLSLLPNVIAAADALAYSHSQNVIHRDLKPGNVFVGEFGETVVIDWGLAKDLSDRSDELDVPVGPYRTFVPPGETIEGAVMGTPAYMPVEQASGAAVDARADVYALGALLYHVLVGAPPFTGKTTEEILHRVIHETPAPITSCTTGVPSDLIAIIEKAMAHDPADRYPTARELSQDLKRFQTGQLVGAREYSAWHHVRRWLRRHRTPVAITGIAVALLVTLGITSLREIVAEQQRTTQQREVAESNRTRAEDLMTFMLTDLGEKLRPIGKLPLLDTVAKKAVDYYENRGDVLDDRENSKSALAHSQLASVLQQQGDTSAALLHLRASLAIYQRLAAVEVGSTKYQNNAATAHNGLGNALRAQGKLTEAKQEFRAAQAIIESLLARMPTSSLKHDLSVVLERIGLVLIFEGDVKGALDAFRKSQALSESLIATDPNHATWQRDLWLIHASIGDALLRQQNVAGALAEYQASFEIAKRLSAKDPTDTNWIRDAAASNDRVAAVLQLQGDVDGALQRYRSGLDSMQSLVTRDPTNSHWQRDLAVGHATIANLLQGRGDLVQALVELRAALGITERIATQDPNNADWQYDLAHHSIAIGEVLQLEKDHKGALAAFRSGITYAAKALARAPTNAAAKRLLCVGYSDLGTILELDRNYQGALEQYRKALVLAKELTTQDPGAPAQDRLAIAFESIGDAQLGLNNKEAARDAYLATVPIRKALVQQDPTNVDAAKALATVHRKLGGVLLAENDKTGAISDTAPPK